MSQLTTRALTAIAAMISATRPTPAQQDSIAARVTLEMTRLHTVIEPDSLDRALFTSVAELLQARVPGLRVMRRGDGGTVIQQRGPASVYADNSPLLIVDGVRISLTRTRSDEFEGRPSPLDDIDVEQIERIEVLQGPAVAALYGTGAANGVIVIRTHAARATPARVRIFAAAGRLDETKSYPANFARSGTRASGGVTTSCTRIFEAIGDCTPTGTVTSFNPLEAEAAVGPAGLARMGASVSAGSDALAWFGGATFEREGSVIDAAARQRVHTRSAIHAQLSPGTALSMRAHWMEGATPLILSEFPALREQALIDPRPPSSAGGLTRYPEPERDVSRRGVSVLADWRGAPWLQGTVLAGLDYSSGTDSYLYASSSSGSTITNAEYTRQRRHDFTGRADVQAAYNLASWLHARTTALFDLIEHRRREVYYREDRSSGGVFAQMFMQTRHDQDVAAVAMQQEIAAADRAVIRLGLRHEDVHLYDVRWKTPWYPQVSVTWLAVKDDGGAFGGLRFRASYGKAGAIPSVDGRDISFPPGPGSPPPPAPRAEVIREREAAFETTLLAGRIDLSASWYSKRASRVMTGYSGGNDVLNRGVEASLRAQLLRGPRRSWDVRVGYAHNHNEVTKVDPAPILFGSGQWFIQGAPIAAYGRFPIATAGDNDGDGVLESVCAAHETRTCEIRYAEQRTYYAAFPPTEVSVENAVRFGPFTVGFLIDHRGGHYLHNRTEALRCLFARCAEAYATSLSLDAASRQASASVGGQFSTGAFVEKSTFTKLREVSVRLETPAAWARMLGGNMLEVSMAGRNLATWTDYSGMDPEASAYGDDGVIVGDLASAPLPRSVSLRFTLTR